MLPVLDAWITVTDELIDPLGPEELPSHTSACLSYAVSTLCCAALSELESSTLALFGNGKGQFLWRAPTSCNLKLPYLKYVLQMR